jgi:hypothetical protein
MTNLTDEQDTLDYSRRQWESGEDRLTNIAPDSRRREMLEAVVDELVLELQRRVGQSFLTSDLIAAYASADRWAADVAHSTAPEDPAAWDLSIVLDAAFHRYAKRASDWGAT